MLTFETFITFFFFFLLPNSISSIPTTCQEYPQCKSSKSTLIQFPFRLTDHQPSYCGHDSGFDLSCDYDKRTTLTLPFSGRFIVEGISYDDQIVWIDDPELCFPRRILRNDVNLTDSPFSYLYGLENSTFLNCSSQAPIRSSPIYCLSGVDYNVIVVPSSWFYPEDINYTTTSGSSSLSPASLSPFCTVLATAFVPRSSPADTLDLNYGVYLAWDLPECRMCQGGSCGFDNSSSTQKIVCTPAPNPGGRHSHSGLSRAAKYWILVGLGITGILCIMGVIVCAHNLHFYSQVRQPAITELSTVISQQPSTAITNPSSARMMGLDDATLETYPKTRLGEILELPNPSNRSCAICLCEYKCNETIRTIPQCKHYFHASCVDEWFSKDVTCPLCRNQPDSNVSLGLPTPAAPSQDTSTQPVPNRLSRYGRRHVQETIAYLLM